MTDPWNPLNVFMYSVFVSAWTALGTMLFFSNERLTLRKVIGCFLFHGLMGGGVAMGVYEFFSLQAKPFRAIVAAIFYGGGVISVNELRGYMKKIIVGIMQSVHMNGPKNSGKE